MSKMLALQTIVIYFVICHLYLYNANQIYAQSHNTSLNYQASSSPSKISFRSWDEAVSYVRANYIADLADTSKSSWIRKAEYYYAEGQGYLIINMNGKDYVFQGVPRTVWHNFKNASSHGEFYHQFIKGRYYFSLN